MFVPAFQSVGHLGFGGRKGSKKGKREKKGKETRFKSKRNSVPFCRAWFSLKLREPNTWTFRSEVVPPSTSSKQADRQQHHCVD